MLEGLVATLLNRFLGMYIRNFDPKQLNIGIWSGDVILRNLELRREALDQLRLPLNVIEGHIGLLTLQIPWSNLKGKPVKVYIEDVFILAAPKEDSEYDEEDEERRRNAVKMERLDSAEMIRERSGEGMSQEEQQRSQSFTESLVTKIVDNLQVTVKNIHIRYEDSISAPGHPFALGFILEEFSAISTDQEWNPTFIQTSEVVTHKLATLEGLAVYWNTDSPLFANGEVVTSSTSAGGIDHDEMMGKLREMISKGENPGKCDLQFVLKPVSGKAKLVMDKTGKVDTPKLKATLLFDEIGFVLDEDQYRDALMMIDLFHYFIRHQEYKKYQPKGVTPKEDPRAWLNFATGAVINKIHDRNRKWSWDYMKERRDDRIRYISLFKKKKKAQVMTPSEADELTKLEWKLSYEDLRFWRSLARNQLKKENASIKKVEESTEKQGWVAWIWGSGKQEQKAEESTVMTDQQRKELYDAIDWDEKAALAAVVDMPRDSVKIQIEASLTTGSFALKRDPHGKGKEIVSLLFDHFKAKVLRRPDSFLADTSLAGLRVYDGTTEGSLFPQIVRVKDAPPVPDDKRIEELGDDGPGDGDRNVSEEEEELFFQLQFEQHPLDDSADSAVTVKLKSMEVIYNPQFIVEIVKFFKPPERHMESIGALMETAGATVEAVRRQTRAGLEFALEEHKTVNAKLDLQAPLIIIPESITSETSNCLIVDAGHVSMISDLVDKETIKEIQSKQRQQYSEEDYRRLEDLMYDKFQLKLEATQVLIGPSISDTKAELEKKDDARGLRIIDRINIDFVVEISILPKAPNLTKFRISGHLPLLHASVSDRKYKSLMKLVDVAIPKFEDDQGKPAKSKDSVKEIKNRPSDGTALKNTKDTFRTSVFEFSNQPQDMLIEDEDSSTEEEEKFEVAPEGISGSDLKLQQRNFELKFTVDKLQGSLFKSDPEGKEPDRLLVELVAEHFELEFYLRPFDMVAEVVLKSLSVDDHVEENPTPEFKKIVSSEVSDGGGQQDLFHVKFVKVNKLSPEFMTIYEAIETNVDVSISTINVVVTRKTVLTLLDFVLLTFTNPNAPPVSENAIDELDGTDEKRQLLETSKGQVGDNKIRVKVILNSIVLILNNDGIRLATLSLNTADIGIFLMGKTMRIGARLGNLNLLDDINQGASTKSPLRQLLTIQGDELADFRYETFDPEGGSAYPGYNSSIYLRSGSLKVNFVSEPFRKIIDFAVKFGKMQAIFNAARQAAMNQANQIQENAGKTHFDILVMTPIVVFPRVAVVDRSERDLITAYLGEIYASNKFLSTGRSGDSATVNNISAGIRNIRLTSDFHFQDGQSEELEMIDKVDVGFKITSIDHKDGAERPDIEVESLMSNFNLRITQAQMNFLLELSRSIPAAFAPDPSVDGEVVQELPTSTANPAAATKRENLQDEDDQNGAMISLGPELGASSGSWTRLDLVFKVQTVGLELLLAKDDEPVGSIDGATLSKFSLNDTGIKLRMISDGSIESELLIDSFTIMDSRTRVSNKFRKIMSSLAKDAPQFMASVTISGGKERSLIAILTIDSPRVIFALDYLFALQDWLSAGLAVYEPLEVETESEEEGDDESESTASMQRIGNQPHSTRTNTTMSARSEKPPGSVPIAEDSMSIAFRVNVVDAQVILIANPTSASSEAILLSTKQVLLSQQHALALQIIKVGMFLCRMDHFETSRLRILDEFGLNLSMDSRSQGPKSSLTNVNVDIEPLVLRLSLRDILLALSIVNKASELSGRDEQKSKDPEPKKIREVKGSSLKRMSASGRGPTTATKTLTKATTTTGATDPAQRTHDSTVVVKREELTANIEGLRVILIGDLHELPLLDLSVKHFTIRARDWSGQMNADTSIDTFINVYNFSKSAWEPLIEPWQLGFHMSRDQSPDCLSVEFYSRKMLEVTITSATIALASKSAQFLSQDEDVLSKPRGVDTPYRIRNYTGFDLNIWADNKKEEQPTAAKLADGEEVPWRFEEWEKMRENLTPEGNASVVGVRLAGSGFDSINKIPVNREGETLYNLRPTQDKVLHRLLVEVKLGADNIKYITFRSPLLVENNTQIPVEIGVFNPEEGHLLKIEKILPGEERPAPVGGVFMYSLLVRPDQGFGYEWSNERLFWRDLLRKPTRTITCRGTGGDRTPPFYFQTHARYDKNDPLTRHELPYYPKRDHSKKNIN